MNDIPLYPHQREAVNKLHNGAILCGGVGTGKSRTALYYYVTKVLGETGSSPGASRPALAENRPQDAFPGAAGPLLYIITTARKRDTKDWEKEAEPFGDLPIGAIDSWNNITKYADIQNAFFIFDEQRVVGYGKWSKTFIRIATRNQWILLTATPGDTWLDYIPVFIANGFYRNKTDFTSRHVVYRRFAKYPIVDRFVDTGILVKHRNDILVPMKFCKQTVPHDEVLWCPFDKEKQRTILVSRWDIFKDEPIPDAGGLCLCLRRLVNSDPARVQMLKGLILQHPKAIVFYNFNYELDLLREAARDLDICCAEWNGQKHEPLPDGKRWMYLVQYTAGAEGWNCTATDTIIFFSQNYSYKIMAQAAGRIDRLNTPYTDLYYYHLCSRSSIDLAIRRAIKEKRNFNETLFAGGAQS